MCVCGCVCVCVFLWVCVCVCVFVGVSVYASEVPRGLIAPCDHTLLGFDSQL